MCLCFLTRLSILLNWLPEKDPVRYDVYCTQVKVAGKAGLIDQVTVSLEQVSLWIFIFFFFFLRYDVSVHSILVYQHNVKVLPIYPELTAYKMNLFISGTDNYM